jgi:hypothetical protein
MIFGGHGVSSALDSVELFNLQTNQPTEFVKMSNKVTLATGGFMNGYPFYCGGEPGLDSCYKFEQSWQKVKYSDA